VGIFIVCFDTKFQITDCSDYYGQTEMLHLDFYSSVSIVSDYGLDDWAIEVQSLTGAEDFSSSPCVQTGSGAHPASYPVGTGGSFPGG
jgi:hypothetical protein